MMLNEAKNVMTTNPGQMLAPGMAIFLVVAAFNFLGDSIQEALNPKINKGFKQKRYSLRDSLWGRKRWCPNEYVTRSQKSQRHRFTRSG